MSGGLPMKIKRNSLVMLRLLMRDLRRKFFPNERDLEIRISKTKGRAKLVDKHEMYITHRIVAIDGCYLRLHCQQNPAEDYSVTVFVPDVVESSGSILAKVIFCEEPQTKLYSVYGASYTRRMGAYLRVDRVTVAY